MTWAGSALFAFAIICENAHVASPIVLAWTHSGLRQIALSRPIETILLPAIAIIGAILSPLWLIWGVYKLWNIYHYGGQHYGVSRILGFRVPRWACIGGTALIMVGGPFLIPGGWWRWTSLIVLDFNHWLTDIGLSSKVSRWWWVFFAGVMTLGCIGFAYQVPRADRTLTLFVPLIIKLRCGVGIWHFLYSRWVWKLSDPQVRAIIGEDIFLSRHSPFRV
jgi:hypothetical protein